MKNFLRSLYSFVPDYYFLNVSSSFFKVLPKDICSSFQSFVAISLNPKKLWRKLSLLVIAQCSWINNGAPSTTGLPITFEKNANELTRNE